MDDTTKQALNDFLQKALSIAEQGVEQLPSVLQEILAWELLSTGLTLGFTLIAIGAILIAYNRFIDDVDRYDRTLIRFLTILGIVVLSVLSFIAIAHIGKVFLAPNLVILGYLRGF